MNRYYGEATPTSSTAFTDTTCLQVASGRLISSSISSVARCKPTYKASSTHDNTCGNSGPESWFSQEKIAKHTQRPQNTTAAMCIVISTTMQSAKVLSFYLYTVINCWRNSGYHQSTSARPHNYTPLHASLHPHPMPAAPSLQLTCFQNIKFTSYSLTDHPGLLQVWMRAE